MVWQPCILSLALHLVPFLKAKSFDVLFVGFFFLICAVLSVFEKELIE